ncbi:MAG: ATP-binding protein [Gemmataceae bacterium]
MLSTTVRCHVFSRLTEGRVFLDHVEGLLKQYEYCERTIHGIFLALEEAFANAIKHGHGLDDSKSVRFTYQVTQERFEAHVEDEGPGFDPCEVPDPTAPENLERNCGRGVFLIRHYMTHVEYNERGNAVRMVKIHPRQTEISNFDTVSDVTM